MTSMYDDLTPSFLVTVARSSLDAHGNGRQCRECTPYGCDQRAWAQQILAEHRARRAEILRPAWRRPGSSNAAGRSFL